MALKLGAGRTAVTDPIDYAAGLDGLLQQGERVEAGAPLGWLCAADEARAQALLPEAQAAFTLRPEPVSAREIIYERMV